MALAQSCQDSPEWWNLRPTPFPRGMLLHYTRRGTHGEHRSRGKVDTQAKVFSNWPVVDGKFLPTGQIFQQGEEK